MSPTVIAGFGYPARKLIGKRKNPFATRELVHYENMATPKDSVRREQRRDIKPILIITSSSPLKNLYASPSGIDFYSPNSPPAGIKSLEPLIAKWWNWAMAIPNTIDKNWPQCLKEIVKSQVIINP